MISTSVHLQICFRFAGWVWRSELRLKYRPPGFVFRVLRWSGSVSVIGASMHGTLTLREVGISDTENGEIIGLLNVVGGTERFEGATGVLTFRGKFTDPTNFEGDLTGEICLP